MLPKNVYIIVKLAVIGWRYTWLFNIHHEYLNPVAEVRWLYNRAVCKVRGKKKYADDRKPC